MLQRAVRLLLHAVAGVLGVRHDSDSLSIQPRVCALQGTVGHVPDTETRLQYPTTLCIACWAGGVYLQDITTHPFPPPT